MDNPDRPTDEGAWPDDDEPVVPEPERSPLPDDPEVPEADAIEQAVEVVPGTRVGEPSHDPEAPEADALEQAIEVPLDDLDAPS